MKINIYKYVQELVESNDIYIPQETEYFFETHIRRSLCITPIRTTWQMRRQNKPEEIWQLQIIDVRLSGACKISKYTIQLSNIEQGYNATNGDANIKSIVNLLMQLNTNNACKRTKDQFMADYNDAIRQFDQNLK